MKKIYILILIIATGALFSVKSHSQGLQAIFHYNTFLAPNEGSFIETYLRIFANTVKFSVNENGKYQAKIDITIFFKKSDEISEWRKYTLLSPELNDTTEINEDFLDQQRITIPNGIYNIELIISDKNTELKPVVYNDIVRVEFDNKIASFSGIQLVEKYQKSIQKNILTKSGYDLYPYVSDFYPNDVNRINYYVELYNIDKVISPNSDFLISSFIVDQGTEKKLVEYGQNQRHKANIVNVFLGSFDISMLPSGNYNLLVEARDRENNLLLSQKTPFNRSNPGVNINLADIPSIDISESFISNVTNIDTLSFYLGSLRPIAGNKEKRFIDNQLKTKDAKTMQQFFLNFWKQRNELFPEAEWKEYYKQVIRVENGYSTKIKHGYQTDRGRIYLQYGAPNDVFRRLHESQAYPYEIWHYFNFGDQDNVKLLFYNPNLVGTEYVLLHSDARGEINNPNWESYLYKRTGGGGEGLAKELFLK
ncbi:GWxTD domain-containing protein [Bacteroidota bacterium]